MRAVPVARAIAAVERALVDHAAGRRGAMIAYASGGALWDLAAATCGAIASRFLAVGTPRTFGIIGDGELSLEAHRTWFSPREIRRATPDTPAAALACDIVCIHAPIAIASSQLRRGTHVNVLAPCSFDPALVALVADETVLGAMAAGLRDGRQLDELTLFVAGGAALALAALTCRSSPDPQ